MTNASNQGTTSKGVRGAIKAETGDNPDEFDLSSDIQGKANLQGDDQNNVVNQRQSQADAKGETDGVIESFEKMDKDVRAERDLGKGNRSSHS